ncbi:MAG: DNA alkylation repair protein [Anaerolineae bacterium]|nr:DNA alkylation repair protein [Anaerolineae bacterium]
MEEGFQLREVFNSTVVETLARDIGRTWPEFDAAGFATDINRQLDALSFGDRNALIRDKLAEYLPPDFPTAARILINSLGPELTEPELSGFDGFVIMSQCDFVAIYGLDHYDISMTALYEMTKRFTAEGAIRSFLQKYPAETLARLEMWSHDENPFVRRLVSEGTRPRLPLAPRLPQFIADPTPVLKLLDHLKTDPILMVRRSVANNLNDIAKDNPDQVVETLRRWQSIPDEGTQWLIRHASRTLIKQGHPGALALLGYPVEANLRLENLVVERTSINEGEDLVFRFTIHSESDQPQNLMIDYVIHFMKANGKPAPKVFKLTKKTVKNGEVLHLSKKHSFRRINTRKHYPGRHRLGIQINGQVLAEVDFELQRKND